MASNDSQMNEEIALLTNEAREMQKDLANEENTTNLASPQTPRWLSFSHFKSIPINWELYNEPKDSLIITPRLPHSLHSPACQCQVCHIQQDDGLSEFGSGSEGDLDPLEQAKCRILGVLKCYLHNLEYGTLVTGSKVDERIEAALKRLVRRAEVAGNCRGGQPTSGDVKESWEISDEECVVAEIDSYARELLKVEADVPCDVLEAADEILDWARTKGTATGREMDMTSSYASFEMVECWKDS
jgi:hypothetical protein